MSPTMRASARRERSGDTDSVRVQIQFDEAGLSLLPTPGGLLVKLDGCVTAGHPGSPGLPSRVIRVALPPATRVIEVSGQAQRSLIVAGRDTLVAPIQPPRPAAPSAPASGPDPRFLSRRVGTIPRSALRRPERPLVAPLPSPKWSPPDPALYARELETPRPPAQLLRIDSSGAQPVAVIELCPVRLIAGAQLEFHPEIEILVRCEREAARTRALGWRGQSRRAMMLLRRTVVNPEMVTDVEAAALSAPAAVDYLIITDDSLWDRLAIRPVGRAGSLTATFQRLADWKARRGLATRVVTISAIVGGTHGDFVTGARDLEEVLRSFLKWARRQWGVAWVLLGGDVDIIPVRRVAGGILGYINPCSSDPPIANGSYWNGDFLKMNVVNPGDWWPGPSASHLLVRPDTGALIPYGGPTGDGHSTWYFTTDDTYSVRTKEPTQFVRVDGPEKEVNATLQWLYDSNTLPTDLYYASLTGPGYDVPDRHDWDLIDNGIYGQHSWLEDLDGVAYRTDVSVGRAPVTTPAEAATFVDKVIAYEQFRALDGTLLDRDWPRRMLLASANFWGSVWLGPVAEFPPPSGTYYHPRKAPYTLLHLSEVPSDLQWNLIAALSATDLRLVPFDLDAANSGHGWYFCHSATDLSPSVEVFQGPLPLIRRPLPRPTEWIVIYAKPDELSPDHYVFDRATQDTSMEGKEAVRQLLAAEVPQIDLVNRLYEDELDLTPEQAAAAPIAHLSSDGLRQGLQAAPHFVSLSGHGWSGGCCGLDVTIATGLTNGLSTFIAYADSCLTNQFDVEDAISEYLVQNAKGGAVAYIGSTRFSWIGVGDDFEQAFFRGLPETIHLGLLADSRTALVDGAYGFGALSKWVTFCLNLIGDPEMPVWISSPRRLAVRPATPPRKGRPFTVQVSEQVADDVVGAPVAGACVHIQQGGVSLHAITDAAGQAILSLSGIERGALAITVSAPGFIPDLSQQVVQEPVWLSGHVAAILHQQGGPDSTLIRLRIGHGDERSFYAHRGLPDYELIIGAALQAHLAQHDITLCLDTPESGGTIERFRIGKWTVPLGQLAEEA